MFELLQTLFIFVLCRYIKLGGNNYCTRDLSLEIEGMANTQIGVNIRSKLTAIITRSQYYVKYEALLSLTLICLKSIVLYL